MSDSQPLLMASFMLLFEMGLEYNLDENEIPPVVLLDFKDRLYFFNLRNETNY
jgi:hypothetical protein